MLLLVQYTLIFSSVLVLVALGGCISEHSGVINLGLEGIMVIGALGGALMMRYLNTSSAFLMVFLVMLAALVLIIGLWNGVRTFLPAYLQALLFLEVMNWFDGIVIDKLWVGYSKFWILSGCEDIPYVQTWKQMLKKRGILTLIWIVGAAIVAGIVMLLF